MQLAPRAWPCYVYAQVRPPSTAAHTPPGARYGLTFEKGKNVRQEKFRVMVLREDMLRRIGVLKKWQVAGGSSPPRGSLEISFRFPRAPLRSLPSARAVRTRIIRRHTRTHT